MGFRNPITTAVDPVARAAAADAQTAADDAQSTANSALSVANGKNTIYIGSSTPTAPAAGFTVGDQWIDTAHGNRLNVWEGGSTGWQTQPWGTEALAVGAVTAGVIAAGAIDGQTITGALIRTAASGQRVQLDSTNGLVGFDSTGQANTQVNPATGQLSAAGATITGTLDTGASSTDPGVKVSTVPGNPATGTVAWRAGPGSAKATFTESTSGGGGAFFTLVSSPDSSGAGPQLKLNAAVDQPAGGTANEIRLLTNDPAGLIVVDRPLSPIASYNAADSGAGFYLGTWKDYGASTAPVAVYRDAAGWAHIAGLTTNGATSIAANANVNFAKVKTGYAPAATRRFTTNVAGVIAVVDVHSDGTLWLVGNPAMAANSNLNLDCHYRVG